jgi:hypothetical protein
MKTRVDYFVYTLVIAGAVVFVVWSGSASQFDTAEINIQAPAGIRLHAQFGTNKRLGAD